MLLVLSGLAEVPAAEPVEGQAERVSAPRRPRSLTAGGKILMPLTRWTSRILHELWGPVRALQLPLQLAGQRFPPLRGCRCPRRSQMTVLEPSLNAHLLQPRLPWRSRLPTQRRW